MRRLLAKTILYDVTTGVKHGNNTREELVSHTTKKYPVQLLLISIKVEFTDNCILNHDCLLLMSKTSKSDAAGRAVSSGNALRSVMVIVVCLIVMLRNPAVVVGSFITCFQ